MNGTPSGPWSVGLSLVQGLSSWYTDKPTESRSVTRFVGRCGSHQVPGRVPLGKLCSFSRGETGSLPQ